MFEAGWGFVESFKVTKGKVSELLCDAYCLVVGFNKEILKSQRQPGALKKTRDVALAKARHGRMAQV